MIALPGGMPETPPKLRKAQERQRRRQKPWLYEAEAMQAIADTVADIWPEVPLDLQERVLRLSAEALRGAAPPDQAPDLEEIVGHLKAHLARK